MRHILAITARELQERRLVFLAAFLAGVVTILVAYFRSFGMGREDSLIVGAFSMIAVFSIGVGLLGGASMMARDLVERRMSFYLARPVSMMEIWGGKMLAALVLALLSATIVVIPIVLVGGRPLLAGLQREDVGGVVSLSALGAVAAVALGHYLSITARSRSTWVALDLVAPLLLAIPIAMVVRWFAGGSAVKLIGGSAVALVTAFVLLLWISSAVGLARGRAELREVHKRTSILLWGGMAIVVASFLAFGGWVRSAGPEDIRSFYSVDPSPSGDGVVVSGRMRGRADYFSTFYLTADGRSERITPSSETIYSADGRVAVVCERGGALLPSVFAERGCDAVEVLRFDGNGVSSRRTTISFRDDNTKVLSPNGSLMAAISNNTFTVWNLAREQMMASARMPAALGVRRLGFMDETTIRFIGTANVEGQNHVEVHEFDLSEKAWRTVSSVLRDGESSIMSSHSLATYFINASNGRSLHDSATGNVLLTIPGATRRTGWAVFLHDDRVLLYDRPAGRLYLYAQRGELIREIVVPANSRLTWPSEPSPGWLALSEWEMGEDEPWKRLWLVNLETGESIKKESDLRALIGWSGPSEKPGSFGSRLFITPDDRLVYFDPFSGERRPVPNV
ncbi:MAG TPA: hypothetical protein VM557_02500 [Thermoanaerobaculia bacterium]|nr:hypothetical protein [Thermoanaerobaculia bacterium]